MNGKEIQELLQQFQSYQQQLQTILLQKDNLKMQQLEIDAALDELEKAEGEGYKIVGPIMVKKPVDELKSELKDKRASIDLRIKTLEKTENRLTQKLQDIQTKLQKLLRTKPPE
ncbi:MAG: prefoldin subunit beta [Candidatus Aenigmarchaeota archaeon]|nr:prefoldin subunit beta [Candidatus Aenigmarchaeota archaeon]